MRKKFNVAFLLGVSLILCSCGNKSTEQTETTSEQIQVVTIPEAETTTEEVTTEETTEEIAPVTITLSSVGDMLMHGGVSAPAVQADGSYNYDYLFTNVKDIISSSDIAIANNEVIMGGNTLGENGNGIIGYPNFNVRTELGDAEVNAGFDVVLGATNHSMDQGVAAITNTINYWKTNHPDMTLLGLYDSAEAANEITVKDVNGIKIALLNYTYGLNGYELPEGYEYAVKLMNEWTKDSIADDLKRANELADFVIVFPHWGTEYQLEESAEQDTWAQFFADNGADLIIGTHPHVIEPVKMITGASGNQTLCYYSLGNFVSIQYYNYSMLGGMARVSITKDSSGTYVSDYDMTFLVTHYTAGRTAVTTYLLDQYTDELASQHAILTEPGENYMAINQYYPFTVAGLKSIAEQVCPDLAEY